VNDVYVSSPTQYIGFESFLLIDQVHLLHLYLINGRLVPILFNFLFEGRAPKPEIYLYLCLSDASEIRGFQT